MCQADNLAIINTVVDLQSRGFYYDFCFVNDRLFCAQQKHFLNEDEFNILEMYRFPQDDKLWQETVIYGIECSQYFMKGILLCSITGDLPTVQPAILKKVSKFWRTRSGISLD
ncbi:MAG: hypothetical protein ABIN94_19650 [Ferruginibacter sp.]